MSHWLQDPDTATCAGCGTERSIKAERWGWNADLCEDCAIKSAYDYTRSHLRLQECKEVEDMRANQATRNLRRTFGKSAETELRAVKDEAQ